MFLKKLRTEKVATSRWLSWRLIGFLTLLMVFFSSLADYFLYQSLLEKDQSLLNARLATYQRIFNHSGPDKLQEVIYAENNSATLWLIEFNDSTGTSLNLLDSNLTNAPKLPDLYWPVIDTSKHRWLILSQVLSEDLTLIIGLNSLPRQEQLVKYRIALASVLIPVLLISAWIFNRIYTQTLLPIRDLLQVTSRIVETQNISERVQVRDPDTELGQLAQQTNDFLQKIEQLIRGMNSALDNVAHDLRTPLARQKLQLEQLLLQPEIQQQELLFQQLGRISEDSDVMSNMLRTLIDISEAENGMIKLEAKVVQLKPLLSQIQDMYSFIAEDRNISIELNCPEDCLLALDSARFQRAIGNLLDNAVKFSPNDAAVKIDVTSGKDKVDITIVDEGPGINPLDLPHIFDRLYRGDQTRNVQGMGLGLSLVKAIVNAHGGSISVDSNTQSGTRFTLALPVS